MEIVNLASPTAPTPVNRPPTTSSSSKVPYLLVVLFAVISGFLLSRLGPTTDSQVTNLLTDDASPVSVSDSKDLEVGVYYGNKSGDFADTATGVVEEGSINGEGTHILVREGGASQRASLTSSLVDLDLFIGKKVEVKGQTNSSNKANWLMDVGAIKILE